MHDNDFMHSNDQGEASMRQFTIAVATVAIAALISAAPASAEHNGGGPIKQNGQCWKASKGSDQMFGHWQSCAEKASGRGAQGRGQGPRAAAGPATTPTSRGPY
jgi:hypothetical protein